MGDWFGVMFNVLYFLNHSFNDISMHDGLGIWIVHVGRIVLQFAQFGSMRPWSLVWVM